MWERVGCVHESGVSTPYLPVTNHSWSGSPVIVLRTGEHDRDLQNVDSLQPSTLTTASCMKGNSTVG